MNDIKLLNVKVLSSFSYVGPLFLMSKFAVEKDIPEVKFHYNQGKVLFWVMSVILLFTLLCDHVLSHFLESISVIFFLIYIGIGVMWFMLALMGIISAIKGTTVKLPFVYNFIKKTNTESSK